MRLRPISAIDYEKYWESVRKYNLWFIKLRYLAASLMLFITIVAAYLIDIQLTALQITILLITSIFILLYNSILNHKISKHINDNSTRIYLKFSFTQIVLDLASLFVITYITGGIESPFFLFFIFHMIIGSLLLPYKLIMWISVAVISLFTFGSLLELNQIIPHYGIANFYLVAIYLDPNFVGGRLIFFSFAIFVSIYLTSQIAKEIYLRERDIKTAFDLLKESEISKQKYIVAVVHELKSPIAAASSLLDLVLGGYLGEVSKDVKEKIEKAHFRNSEAIENINSILRVSKFKLLNQLEIAKIDLIELIESVIDTYSAQLEKKTITLNFEKNNFTKFEKEGDEVLLRLVFSNLIGNAIKYNSEKGEIEIKIIKDKIFISDNGIGIPKDELPKIFSEYFRASNTKISKIEGTGTGLNVVKQVLDSHKWEIEAFSPSLIGSENKPGVTFVITF